MLKSNNLPVDFGKVLKASLPPPSTNDTADPFANLPDESIVGGGLGASIAQANMEARLIRLEANQ